MAEEEYGPLEKQAVEIYRRLFPWEESEESAKAMAREIIAKCKAEAKADGWDKVPDRFGDWLLEHAESGNNLLTKIIENARKDGARDEDIRNYWNMKEWERRLITFCDNYFRSAAYLKMKDEGLPEELILKNINKAYPFYGDPDDTSKCSDQDRPLPFEIKDRVNSYLMNCGFSSFVELELKLSSNSSVNAFIREEIRKGLM